MHKKRFVLPLLIFFIVMYALSRVFFVCVCETAWLIGLFLYRSNSFGSTEQQTVRCWFLWKQLLYPKTAFHNSTERTHDNLTHCKWRWAQPHTVNICNISGVYIFPLEHRNNNTLFKNNKLPWLHWHLISTYVWNLSLNTWLYLICTTNSSL